MPPQGLQWREGEGLRTDREVERVCCLKAVGGTVVLPRRETPQAAGQSSLCAGHGMRSHRLKFGPRFLESRHALGPCFGMMRPALALGPGVAPACQTGGLQLPNTLPWTQVWKRSVPLFGAQPSGVPCSAGNGRDLGSGSGR